MRVVGGTVRNRRLAPFKATGIRPTSDKVREAVFNVLDLGFEGKAVLDIFAGTGAMGIEALSRGAASAVFVDNSKGATGVIKKNLSLCGFEKEGRILNKDVEAALSQLKGKLRGAPARAGRFDLIFIDAPYAETEQTAATLKTVARSGLLNKDACVVCEVAKKNTLEGLPEGLALIKEKTYGDTRIYFLKSAQDKIEAT